MDTRKKILDTTFKLIAEKGYDKTSVSMICETVGIKKPSLYYYFDSKENLFITLIKEMVLEDTRSSFDFNVSKENFQSELVKYGENSMNMYKEYPEFSNFVMELYIQTKRIKEIGEEIDKMNNSFKERLTNIIICGEELGILNKEDRDVNCDMIYVTIQGLEFSIIYGREVDQDKVWRNIVKKMCM